DPERSAPAVGTRYDVSRPAAPAPLPARRPRPDPHSSSGPGIHRFRRRWWNFTLSEEASPKGLASGSESTFTLVVLSVGCVLLRMAARVGAGRTRHGPSRTPTVRSPRRWDARPPLQCCL